MGLDTKTERPAKQVLRTIVAIFQGTPVRELQMAFKLPYVYDYTTIMQTARSLKP
jgi:hypothetical protein